MGRHWEKYQLEFKYLVLTSLLILLGNLLQDTQIFLDFIFLIGEIAQIIAKLGLIGIFLIALMGSSTILIQVPYTLPLLSAALRGASLETMLLLGFMSGLGSAIGKSIAYLITDRLINSQSALANHRFFEWVKHLAHHNQVWIPAIIFFFVATPLPDDVVIIPLATIKYGLRRLWVPLYTGKITHTLSVALMFYFFTDFSARHMSGEFRAGLASLLLLAFIMYLLYQAEKARLVVPQTAIALG